MWEDLQSDDRKGWDRNQTLEGALENMQGPQGLPLQRVWNGVQCQEKVSEARSQLQRDALLQEVSKIFQNKNLDS